LFIRLGLAQQYVVHFGGRSEMQCQGAAEVRPTRRSTSTGSGGQQRSAPATASKNPNLLLRWSLA
jgi:hypothetical protein